MSENRNIKEELRKERENLKEQEEQLNRMYLKKTKFNSEILEGYIKYSRKCQRYGFYKNAVKGYNRALVIMSFLDGFTNKEDISKKILKEKIKCLEKSPDQSLKILSQKLLVNEDSAKVVGIRKKKKTKKLGRNQIRALNRLRSIKRE